MVSNVANVSEHDAPEDDTGNEDSDSSDKTDTDNSNEHHSTLAEKNRDLERETCVGVD